MNQRTRFLRLSGAVTIPLVTVALLALSAPLAATAAAPYPSDTAKPDLPSLLSGYTSLWKSDGVNDLHGTVVDGPTLAHNDELAVWINGHATPAQQFLALQDSEYQTTGNTSYDQSITIATALGSVLAPIYVTGRQNGSLPLTSALINSSNGTSGAYVSTGASKAAFSYPRPYLPTDPTTPAVAGDDAGCAPTTVNASSLTANRVGTPYASSQGNLLITRVPAVVDTTHQFSTNDVSLNASYSGTGICTGGAFPSGHTTTAYQAGITLATLLPSLAPEILTRASEAGNDRIVLGVHYPLDIMGGRMSGEAALAARWSDTKYRTEVLEPAQKELTDYLQQQCGGTLDACLARGAAYQSNPYGGQAIPGGTSQIVTDRASAVAVYGERLDYGFAKTGAANQAPSVPAGAENLLLSTFPSLSDAQRASVLAQTQIASGDPLDLSGSAAGSWQRLNLAAATSATVQLNADGSVTVASVGGKAAVLPVAASNVSDPGSATDASGSSTSSSLAATGLDAEPIVIGSVAATLLGLGMVAALGVRRRRTR
ncbi:phosphatase PAP2 family protein [Agreia pratensis]|uniref:phosphatase PAP2 family protein n=1 Tax=Agreia pratensis TaxID=150121 RepID=UPI00188D95AF|nr:phosphatase PAP2 family protein [Agreia pratensis]MBF4635040.1 phosphatase PAP2 family protein [Agreia pratensis]